MQQNMLQQMLVEKRLASSCKARKIGARVSAKEVLLSSNRQLHCSLHAKSSLCLAVSGMLFHVPALSFSISNVCVFQNRHVVEVEETEFPVDLFNLSHPVRMIKIERVFVQVFNKGGAKKRP